MRFEAAIDTPLAFREGGLLSGPAVDAVGFSFHERRYVWHNSSRDDGRRCWPVVTTMVSGDVDTIRVETGISRLLSALSFHYSVPMSIATTASAGWKEEFDSPLIGQPGYGARQLEAAPTQVQVLPRERLQLTLALCREARSARSPAYRYLAYYNALDAAFDDDQDARADFVNTELGGLVLPEDVATDWAGYLREVLRNAVAHAVRPEGRPMLDPDETTDRRALTGGASHLAELVRKRIESRWPGSVRVLTRWTS